MPDMSEGLNGKNDACAVFESYTIVVERKDTEFEVTQLNIPSDDFGRKMLALMLYNIGEQIDPAFNKGKGA